MEFLKRGRKNGRWMPQLVLFLVIASLITTPLAQAQQANGQKRGRTAPAGEAGRKAATKASPQIRLVVGIVIDQFRYDYLTRFEDQFVEGGFRRFLTRGANFTENNYLHTPTYTAPGHATFMSGTTPALNGIIGNEWYDRKSGKTVSSVSDGNVKQLGGRDGGAGASPHRLIGSTLGDQMKLTSQGRSKVVGISLKDRSAILPVGKRPDGAYWYDGTTGNFVSSTWYFNELPAWVKKFNQEQHSNTYFDKVWERLLPESAYARSAADDSAYEGKDHIFPHVLKGSEAKPGPKFYGEFQSSPFANDHLANLARAAIENEQLGADEIPDLLTISFSSNDLVGHSYGPYSQEVQDITLRTDRTIAELFSYLDRKIGLDHIVFALTADHGVGPVPEQVKPLGYGGRINASAISDAVEKSLDTRYGDEKWVLSTGNGNVYLDLAVIGRKKIDVAEAETIAAMGVMTIPGIAECYTRSQIISGRTPETRLSQSVVLGFNAERNGNLVVLTEPFYLVGGASGASHGTPYSYDTHVPLLLLGPGIKSGWYTQPSSPADIAPTLASILKLTPPSNRSGRVLGEALIAR